jgi:hypothetical protein
MGVHKPELDAACEEFEVGSDCVENAEALVVKMDALYSTLEWPFGTVCKTHTSLEGVNGHYMQHHMHMLV